MEQLTKAMRAEKLAAQILNISRNTLVVHMRYLDAALIRLTPQPSPQSLATDGVYLYYEPTFILSSYKQEKNCVTRDYLHVLLHCIFRHPFVDPGKVNQNLWNLACDIAVENIISSFSLSCVETSKAKLQQQALSMLSKELKTMTAEKIYLHLLNHPNLQLNMSAFHTDDHSIWYQPQGADGGGSGSGESESPDEKQNELGDGRSRQSLMEEWREVSERIQTDMETISITQGNMAGSMRQQLRQLNRERYDYRAFLKKFAVMGEAMKINDDEFDYIFYTYGLKLFGNMPLIEPLEYKEVKRIRDFVIAIDTSGSTSGYLVQMFLQKTFNILKSQETFFTKINLYIIQCDAQIQEVRRITSQEEFDEYIRTFTIKGLGGTDFRPVFTYVDKLIAEKTFTNLKGLIYFTDGYGDFPAKKPDYQTAFVFLRTEWNNPNIPPWAIKLVLDSEEIQYLKTTVPVTGNPQKGHIVFCHPQEP